MAADARLLAVLTPPAVVVDEDPGSRPVRIAEHRAAGLVLVEVGEEREVLICNHMIILLYLR